MTGLKWKAQTGEDWIKTRAARAAERHQTDGRLGRVAQTGTVLTVVTIGVFALVGILIFSEINDALPEMSTNESHDDYHILASSQNDVVDGFGSSMELVPVVLIVLIAAVVLGVVQRMR